MLYRCLCEFQRLNAGRVTVHGLFSRGNQRVEFLRFVIIGQLQLSLPAPDILRRRQIRRAQPEQLIVEREQLRVFGDCVREQHPATVAAVLQCVLISGSGIIMSAFRFW